MAKPERDPLLVAIGSGADASFASSRLKAACALIVLGAPWLAVGVPMVIGSAGASGRLPLIVGVLFSVPHAILCIWPFRVRLVGSQMQISSFLRSDTIDLTQVGYCFDWYIGRHPWPWALRLVAFQTGKGWLGMATLPPFVPRPVDRMIDAFSRRIRLVKRTDA